MTPPKSAVWNFLNRIDKETASCKICFKVVKTSGNTSNLNKHMKKHPENTQSQPNNDGKRKETRSKQPTLLNIMQHNHSQQQDAVPGTSSEPEHSSTSVASTVSSTDTETELRRDVDVEMNMTTVDISIQKRPRMTLAQMSMEKILERASSYAEGGTQHNILMNTLLYFICVDKRPFDIVSGRGFRRFVKALSPLFKLPAVDTLKIKLDDFYAAMEYVYRNKFNACEMGSIALTCDIWSEMMSTRSLLGVTVHFLEGTKLISRCISTKELENRHTALYIAENLGVVCTQFSIVQEKIACIITDNGANIVAAVNLFLGKPKHLPCFAHTLNLVVESVMKIESLLIITNKVREVVLFFKGSVVQSDLLRSKQRVIGNDNPLKLILDVKTRGNSVYYMLERYVKVSSVVHQILLDNNPKAPSAPTAVELSTIKKLINLLQHVEYVRRVVSGEQYVTISKIIPLINVLKTNVNDVEEGGDDTDTIALVKQALLHEIDVRFKNVEQNHIIAIACILDPRFKTLHFKDATACAKAMTNIRKAIQIDASSSSDTDSESSPTRLIPSPPRYNFWFLVRSWG